MELTSRQIINSIRERYQSPRLFASLGRQPEEKKDLQGHRLSPLETALDEDIRSCLSPSPLMSFQSLWTILWESARIRTVQIQGILGLRQQQLLGQFHRLLTRCHPTQIVAMEDLEK
mmetsp:Transcript_31894/g.61670  ORF Transcript_31894/g.61670 Transcript_31894/m.61670 type:complete len:117 (+) Transcript_31894:1133-1483(+)